MPREQLARKEADIVPLRKSKEEEAAEKEAQREEFFKYSLGEGREKREALGKLNEEIRGLEEELEILEDALDAQYRQEHNDVVNRKNKKVKNLTSDEIASIEEAVDGLRQELRKVGQEQFDIETKITPDANELLRVRNQLRIEKREKRIRGE